MNMLGLEMKRIEMRGMSREDLELRRYAASELKGDPQCLLAAVAKRRLRPSVKEPAMVNDNGFLAPSSSAAQV